MNILYLKYTNIKKVFFLFREKTKLDLKIILYKNPETKNK